MMKQKDLDQGNVHNLIYGNQKKRQPKQQANKIETSIQNGKTKPAEIYLDK